jgi:hypothetical protein
MLEILLLLRRVALVNGDFLEIYICEVTFYQVEQIKG